MKRRFVVVAVAAFLCLAVAPSIFAFDVNPFRFIGTASQCPGGTAGTDIIGSDWVQHFGLVDCPGCTQNQALMFSKNGPSSDCSAAGATIPKIKGITLINSEDALGFDIRNGSHCEFSPRFEVDASDGPHFILCPAGTHTAGSPQEGWTRVRINPHVPSPFIFPGPLSGGATINSITLVFDDGVDVGTDFSGFAILDNIELNGALRGRD